MMVYKSEKCASKQKYKTEDKSKRYEPYKFDIIYV